MHYLWTPPCVLRYVNRCRCVFESTTGAATPQKKRKAWVYNSSIIFFNEHQWSPVDIFIVTAQPFLPLDNAFRLKPYDPYSLIRIIWCSPWETKQRLIFLWIPGTHVKRTCITSGSVLSAVRRHSCDAISAACCLPLLVFHHVVKLAAHLLFNIQSKQSTLCAPLWPLFG